MLCFVALSGSMPKLNERFVLMTGNTSVASIRFLSFVVDVVACGLVDCSASVIGGTGRADNFMLLCELNEMSLSSSSVQLCDVAQLTGMAFVRARSESSSRLRNLRSEWNFFSVIFVNLIDVRCKHTIHT